MLSSLVRTDGLDLKLSIADLLLPLSVALWAIGVHETNASHLGPFGLVTSLAPLFYLGVVGLFVYFLIELRREHPDPRKLALVAIVVVVALYGTAALVYPDGRYPWLYKTLGIVQYVNVHGQLNRHIDIYQNWPGFFAVAAWFDKVAGLASPVAYAKWAQMVFELAALPLLYVIFRALGLTVRQQWLAIVLYFSSNWIGQDYLSPQGLGTVLSLGVLALACRYLLVDGAPLWRKGEQAGTLRNEYSGSTSSNKEVVAACIALISTYFVLTYTHELSPYTVLVQLSAIAIAGRLRPRWLPIVLGAIAIGYLAPRFAFVNSRYGLLASFGKFFSNALTPATTSAATGDQQLLERSVEVLSGIIWLLAVVGVWARRRAGYPVLALALLAFSPIFVIAGVHYGNEATLRVFLFSLPWSAALASCVLAPAATRPKAANVNQVTSAHWYVRFSRAFARGSMKVIRFTRVARLHQPARHVYRAVVRIGRPLNDRIVTAFRRVAGETSLTTGRCAVTLLLTVGLFFPAFFGNDRFYVMTPSEVTTIRSFLRTATPGPIYVALDFAPYGDTARYNEFPIKVLWGPGGFMAPNPGATNLATAIANAAVSYTDGSEPSYLLITPSMYAYDEAFLFTPRRTLAQLERQLVRSSEWKLVAKRSGTEIYKLPATPPTG
jgi:hypothetical protein